MDTNRVRYRPIDWEKLRTRCSSQSIKHLERSLASLEAGREPTPSFKLYGRTDVGLVESFIRDYVENKSPQWNVLYEKTRLKKFGPQGGYKPWKELQELAELYVTRPVPVSYCDPEILREMKAEYSELRVQKLALDSTLANLIATDKINDRAAGDPTFNLLKTDKLAQSVALAWGKERRYDQLCGYVFSRYQKQKARIFMPMPYASMLVQASWYLPFLERIQDSLRRSGSGTPFIGWADKIGFEGCFSLMGEEINTLKSYPSSWKLVYVQLDFEKMDTTTGPSQYATIFVPVIGSAFGGVTPDLQAAMMYTTMADIITPAGVLHGAKGTASGAEVTNGGESVCNDYYQRRLLKILNKLVTGFVLLSRRFNGDDGAFVFAVENYAAFERALKQAGQEAAKECGFRVQAEKWHISTEYGLYCQNEYYYDEQSRTVIWWYPAALILNSIINPERQYSPAEWDKDYRDIDVIEKLDNGSREPYFHQLVDYVAKGMKYPLLGTSERETSRILSKYEKYRSLQPLDARFNRQTYDISHSPTVKYLLSQRG